MVPQYGNIWADTIKKWKQKMCLRILGEYFPGKEKNKCKASEAGVFLAWSLGQ